MKRLLRAFAYSCVFAVLTVVSVSLFWETPVRLALFLVALSAALLSFWGSREDVYLYAISAACGALAEAFAIGFKAWAYPKPDMIGIPVWLPFVWGIAGVFIKRTSLEIHDFLKDRTGEGKRYNCLAPRGAHGSDFFSRERGGQVEHHRPAPGNRRLPHRA